MKKIFLIIIAFFLAQKFCSAQYTKLKDFTGGVNGNAPNGSLVSDGTFLYGTTVAGGTFGLGNVFKIKPDGTGYASICDFSGAPDGKFPYGTLYFDGIYLYGMTEQGGTTFGGIIFKIKPDGTSYTKLFDFDIISGSKPYGGFVSDGIFLYGMTSYGGGGGGSIFKIKPDGTSFQKLLDLGTYPRGTMIFIGGDLYGTAPLGGAYGNGTLFKIKTDGTGYADVVSFGSIPQDGRKPSSYLYFDGNYIYGMTDDGGAFGNDGTIYRVKPDGSNYLKLYDFFSNTTGSDPQGGLISDGTFLYGMTYNNGNFSSARGTIFRIKPDGTGYSKIHNFEPLSEGTFPMGNLYSDGSYFYGLTQQGGSSDFGVVFKNCIPPNVSISANLTTSCNGQGIILSGTGADSLFWSHGLMNGVAFFPPVTDTFMVVGTTLSTGCSDTASVIINVATIDTTISFDSISLTANQAGVNYQWVDCSNGYSFVWGQNNQTINPFATGSFAVILSNNGCVDTSSCYNILEAGVEDYSLDNKIIVFPNPANSIAYVEIPLLIKDAQLKIINILGEVVYEKNIKNLSLNENIEINVSEFQKGIYSIFIEIDDEFLQKKIIVN